MIRCEQVGFSVHTTQGDRAVLVDVSFEAPAAAVTWLQGPSGAGKSTLMSILALLRRPTSGQVVVDGQPVSRFTATHRDRFRQRVGLVHQRLYLFDELNPLENVLLAVVPRGRRAHDTTQAARELLRALELDTVCAQPVRTLSGGERQRVAVARALIAEPSILLLDEPTAHQDDARTSRIWELVAQHAAQGACVVVAAHDPRVAERVAPENARRLREGRLVEHEDA